jgi:hypothetical protein
VAAVGLPGVENIIEGGGGVAYVDASPVQVEPERIPPAVAEGEGGGSFGRVGEPVQFAQTDRAMAGLDVTEYTAGTDRSELLIITNQPDTATALHNEVDGGIQGEGVGHPGFVDDHQAGPADAVSPIGQVIMINRPGEFRQRVGWCARGVAELRRCCGRWGQPEHLAPAVAPRPSQRAHRGGLASASRGDRELQPRPRGTHGTNQSSLPGIQGVSVGGYLQ